MLLPLLAFGAVGIAVALLVPSSGGAAPTPTRGDASITLTVDGVTLATFNSCSGIGSQTTPGQPANPPVHSKTFGTNQPIQVTCERTGPVQSLWAWRQLVVLGDPTAPRTAELDVADSTGQVLQKYTMTNAWIAALNDTARVGAQTTEVVTFTADEIAATFPTSTG